MTLAAIQQLPHFNHIAQLTPIEKERLGEFQRSIESAIYERNDLEPFQKESILQELMQRVNQIALERHFYREAPNISLRGIHLEIKPTETICEVFTKGSIIGLGIVVISSNPIIGGTALVTSYIVRQAFDDECFLNKFFRWLGCIKKAEPAPALILPPFNQN